MYGSGLVQAGLSRPPRGSAPGQEAAQALCGLSTALGRFDLGVPDSAAIERAKGRITYPFFCNCRRKSAAVQKLMKPVGMSAGLALAVILL